MKKMNRKVAMEMTREWRSANRPFWTHPASHRSFLIDCFLPTINPPVRALEFQRLFWAPTYYLLGSFTSFFFETGFLESSPGWPGTCCVNKASLKLRGPGVHCSEVLELKVCATPGLECGISKCYSSDPQTFCSSSCLPCSCSPSCPTASLLTFLKSDDTTVVLGQGPPRHFT